MNILKRIGKFLRRRFLGLFYYTPINLSEEREHDDTHPNDQYIRLSHVGVGVTKKNWLVYPMQPIDFSTNGIHFISIPMSSNMDEKPTLRSVSPAPREIQNEFRPSLKVPPRYFHPKWFSSSDTDTWVNLKEPHHLKRIESPSEIHLPPKM